MAHLNLQRAMTRARTHFPSGSVEACSRKTLGGHGENTFPLNTIHQRQRLGDGYGKISEIECDAAFYGDCHRHRHRDVGDGRGDPRKITPSLGRKSAEELNRRGTSA